LFVDQPGFNLLLYL